MKRIAILILALAPALAGCAGTPALPKIQIQTVTVEVPVPCHVDIGPEPSYPDTDAALAKVPFPAAGKHLLANPHGTEAFKEIGADLLYEMKLLRGGRAMRIARDARKSAALSGCAGDHHAQYGEP